MYGGRGIGGCGESCLMRRGERDLLVLFALVGVSMGSEEGGGKGRHTVCPA